MTEGRQIVSKEQDTVEGEQMVSKSANSKMKGKQYNNNVQILLILGNNKDMEQQ
jgi:hypothetical protein